MFSLDTNRQLIDRPGSLLEKVVSQMISLTLTNYAQKQYEARFESQVLNTFTHPALRQAADQKALRQT